MSNHLLLAAAEPLPGPAELAVWAIFALFAIVLAFLAGVFRRHSIVGPARLDAGLPDARGFPVIMPGDAVVAEVPVPPPSRPLSIWPILLSTLFGVFVWVVIQFLIGAYRSRMLGHAVTADELTPFDFGLIATLPGIAGFVTIWLTNALLSPILIRRLGFSPARLPIQLAKGLLTICIAFPLVMWVSYFSELFYRWIHYEHPYEHDLLRALNTASPTTKVLLIVGAVFIAPLFEETLFRAHLQSILRRFFHRPWRAVFLTSLCFAAVHPAWSMPPIFVLSLCLGYAYERTGNLWVNITAHALFNAISTAIYIYASH